MDLDHALAFSHYARRTVDARPELRAEIDATLDAPFDWAGARATIAAATAADAATALGAALRALRARVMVHTLARDLTGRATLEEVCGAVTTLAELAAGAAVDAARRDLVAAHGEPRGAESGAPQPLVVVGMGKLGGAELNVSSDVDLVFVYPEEGETDGRRAIANREFFDRLGRRVIALLDETTADGFVFRVDMRLRPYGDSGPLSVSYAALENYLVTQGRAWERYAWLKARALTGASSAELDAIVAPFVYRKYLDYDAYAGLRDVHRQIREQAARRDARENIKLGPGGIREIEFIVQAMQIVRGGREPGLRIRNTRAALAALASRGHLPESAAAALDAAYAFLRDTEHRLQYRDDHQTQSLPDDPAELDALARAMRFDGERAFRAALDAHRREAGRQFASVFGAEAPSDEGAEGVWRAVWDAPDAAGEHAAALAAAGFADPATLLGTLARARAGSRYAALPAQSRERFDVLVPRMLAAAAASPGAEGAQATFLRLFGLLEAVARRSAYLALVIEHPPLVPRLAGLMGASAWAADYLTRHPILLDELLDGQLLEPIDYGQWMRQVQAQLALAMLPGGQPDVERQMDIVREAHHAQVFRLLAQDLEGLHTVERLSDHLSELADRVLELALAQVWPQVRSRHREVPRFAVIAYGRLGGKELGYASDLDLVFVYDDPDERAAEAYSAFSQRLAGWLSSRTAAGLLFEIDLRLRPNGNAGLIVTSLKSYCDYQRESAWVWEHQALTRARFAAGDRSIGEAFEAERRAILSKTREAPALRAEVIAMRRKMHDGHPNRSRLFDLKHDDGGMVDIEFIVQYLVLAHSDRHPGLLDNKGNIALLARAGDAGLVDAALARRVADAYREFRQLQHSMRLNDAQYARVDPESVAARRADVRALWKAVLEP